MKTKFIKKMMTGALAAALVMAPSLSAFASTTNNSVTNSGSGYSVVEAIVSASSGAVETVAEIPTTSSVAGVKTTVAGIYLATNVNGSIVTTSVAAIKEGYGLTNDERPYAKFSNLDKKKSYLAKQALEMAAASQGAEVGPMLNIELGKMTAGKYSLLPADGPAIRICLGIPASFKAEGKTYAVVCVRAGGAVTILEDVDTNPATLTFDTNGGAAAYAIIRY